MKAFLALFFLGVLQGVTEFLPVSSSGHLVLFSKILGIEESLLVSIVLHIATLLSIIVVFRKDVWKMIKNPLSKESMMIVVATIPTCVIVLILLPLVKQSFAGVFLPLCFAISAVLLFVAQVLSQKQKEKPFNFKSALIMGIAQGLAVFPGVSRSGTTISAGLLNGNQKTEVAKFSFLMSLPIVLLSLLMEIVEISMGVQKVNVEFFSMFFSFLTAFVVGVFSIKVMMKLTAKANLKWFSIYLIVLSIVSLFFI